MLGPPAALLPVWPAAAGSFANGFLLVAQRLLDGVLAPAACNERVQIGSVPEAVASFSPAWPCFFSSTRFTLLLRIVLYRMLLVNSSPSQSTCSPCHGCT